MIQLSEKTLSYKTREVKKTSCRHCSKFRCRVESHIFREFFDPESSKWTECCLCCGMFEHSSDQERAE